MKFQLKTQKLNELACDCIIVFCYEKDLSAGTKQLDSAMKKQLSKMLACSNQINKPGDHAFFPITQDLKTKNILLIQLGNKIELCQDSLKSYLASAFSSLAKTSTRTVTIALNDLKTIKNSSDQDLLLIAETLTRAYYRFETFKSKAHKNPLTTIYINVDEKQKSQTQKSIKNANGLAQGMTLSMDLANMPPNVCNPSYLAKQAKDLAKQHDKFTTKIVDHKALEKLGAGAILAVGQGSDTPPCLVCMEYKGGKANDKPQVFVGKGITFDTGGNNIKSFAGMLGMKYDMCGGASVFGLMKAVAHMKLPINVVGIVAAAENMPGSKAYRPEDIIKTLSGKTIEVLNTDAEGRLVLCDALTYAEKYKPKAVIDLATLTGAMITSLGYVASGVFSNDDDLANDLEQAAITSRDKVWRLPVWSEYTKQISSDFADLSNMGGAAAGSITAACFLAEFAKKYPWAHIDIAGTASLSAGLKRHATGRPMALLVSYLLGQV
jgi:leucyl aminopeptidase